MVGGSLFFHFLVMAFLPATSNILGRYLFWLLGSVGILPKYTVPKLNSQAQNRFYF